MTPTDPTTAGKTPTPTPEQVEAESRAEFLHFHKAPKDWLIVTESEVAALKAELAAKDAELMTARQEKNSYKRAATELAEEHLEETEKLHAQLATLRQQLADANDALHQCLAATGDDAGDRDDFRGLVNREKVTVDAVKGMRAELDTTEAFYRTATEANAALRAEVERLKGALELGQENCDAEYDRLRDERDEMTRIAQDASRGELAAIQRESAFKAAADRLAGALKPFLENTGVCAPIASDHPLTGPWVKYRDGLIGRWAEDGSPYYIRLPAQLADSLIEAQRLATLAYLGRDALADHAKLTEGQP